MDPIGERLTVVVPAYRSAYLAEALRSLADQTRPVTAHVFDDASPEPVEGICEGFKGRLDVRYHRFERNLGGQDLAAHWNRCIELVDADWIWLFSDDDVADPRCVESFQERLLNGTRCDVFCFRTRTIGPEGELVRDHVPPPRWETAAEYLAARLSGTRESFVPDHVFRRERWKEVGGFPSYPLAWYADDAFWIEAGRQTGIAGLDSVVNWRRSGQNLSSFHPALCERKFDALCQFDEHLARGGWWDSLEPSPRAGQILRREWFWRSFQAIGCAFPPVAWSRLRRGMSDSFPQGALAVHHSFLRSWLFRLTHPVG